MVDDEPYNRELLLQFLLPYGFQIKAATTGKEAVILATTFIPDLIFMDIRMVGVDGCEAAQQIKRMRGKKLIKIIAVTAGVFEEDKARILASGCDDFLGKPFREAEILTMLQKHLGYQIKAGILKIGNKPATEQILSPGTLATLATELLIRLQKSTFLCDMETVEKTINEIEVNDPIIAQELRQLANRFDYDTILRLVEQSWLSCTD